MTELAQERCEPCSGDSPAVPEADWRALLESLDDWQIEPEDGVPMLTRRIRRQDFVAALTLAQRIGDLAEAENHHPRLIVEYGSLTVSWWTHTIRGLHRNDFIMAARTDALV